MNEKDNQVQILLDAVNNATAEIRAVRQEMALVDDANKKSAATTDAATLAANRHKAALAANAVQLKNVGVAAQTSMKGLAALRGSMLMIGGTVAPQFTGAMMLAVSSMEAAKNVSGALNVSFVRLATRLTIVGAALGGGYWAWKKYDAAQKEADQSAKDWGEQQVKQIKLVEEELRVLDNMGLLNQDIKTRIMTGFGPKQIAERARLRGMVIPAEGDPDALMSSLLGQDPTAALSRLSEYLRSIGKGSAGAAAMRRDLQAELLDGTERELADVNAIAGKRWSEIEAMNRAVELTKEESAELLKLVDLVAEMSENRIKAAAAEEAAARAFQAKQVGAGLSADLLASNARLSNRGFGIDPDAAGQADLAAELLAHNSRLRMIAELGMKEAEARGFRETAEAVHSARLIEIERQTSEAKKLLLLAHVDATANSFAQIADAAKMYGKEGFAVFKALAMAEAIISTYSSAVKAYSSVVGVPYVGPILAPIAAGAAVAAGVANVAQIAAATPGYATGGVVPGSYNGKDDRLIAVGPGEVILNPRQARMIGMENIYAALAATGGKIPNRLGPASQANHFNTGGIVTGTPGLGSVTNFSVGLISSRQEEREFQLRQGTRIMLRELEQRKVRR